MDGEAIMKIEDYAVIVAGPAEDLRLAVLAKVKEGWDVFGAPGVISGPVGSEFFQGMVWKYDPHPGEVWVKLPGFQGYWEKVGK